MSVSGAGNWVRHQWKWSMEKIIRVSGEDINFIAEQLLELLKDYEPVEDGLDSYRWIKENDGAFTVKSCYKAFANKTTTHLITTNTKETLASLWKVRVPSNIQLFGWRFILNRLPTKDNLIARGIEIEDSKEGCEFCGNTMETRYHLFFECPFSTRMWDAVHTWMGSPMWIKEKEFMEFPNYCEKAKRKDIREVTFAIWMAVIWTLWLTRNAAIFNDDTVNFEDCLSSIKFVSWKWINLGKISTKNCCSYYEWHVAPLLSVF
ncbi:uncharacterized protein LOC131614048 [Vicia villosa]|uniref:uncharacterized protein LOC131614048 n=1 Tax=Vicia villosa TaxID=3911 RepID=UPI00273B87E1|nr:uncharacterized protein LOC131614048 [Vicia villosa]